MRILHVITTLDVGGAERLMVDLLPLLSEYGDQVDLLLFNGVDTSFKTELESKGIKVYELSHEEGHLDHREVYNPLNILRLRKYLGNYDIIHTHNTACQFFVPFANVFVNSHAKFITTEHNATNRRRSIWWLKPLDLWMYKKYSSIVCISDQTYKNLNDYIGAKDKIRTIYNGVGITRFLKPIKNIEGQGQFVITMVAAFREQKDHDTLLKAVALLPNNYSLRLVGHGDTELKVKQNCSELGIEQKVTFMGLRMDVSDILESSDVIVLSSHWEGLSLSSIEGMASGRPFVASDVDGLHEIVSGAGILFPQGDENALSNAIRELCENPAYYKQVAQSCQERAKNYDITKMAQAYHELYESLL